MSLQRGTAHGKALLFGEHFVVHGSPAIAVGLTRGVTACAQAKGERLAGEASAAGRRGSSLAFVPGGPTIGESDDSAVGRALAALLAESGTRLDWDVRVHSELPPRAGLGSSAAVAVALARTIVRPATRDAVVRAATAWEEVFHVSPSGVDIAAAIEGGCLHFTRGQPNRQLPLGGDLLLCVGTVGESPHTGVIVREVSERARNDPGGFATMQAEVVRIVAEAEPALAAGELEALGELLDRNHAILAHLGVSTRSIDIARSIAVSSGALGAKLTGAGGGGSVVALAPSFDVAEEITTAWLEAGFTSFVDQVEAQSCGAPRSALGGRSRLERHWAAAGSSR